MRFEQGTNYSYLKSSSFTSKTSFTLVKKHSSFERDEHGVIILNSAVEVTFSADYEISEKGEILKVSKEEFGKVEIKTAANN